MTDKIEIEENGLKCDNPKCDWNDKSITFDVYKDWINKPCPKCGENVLTQQDYDNAEAVKMTIDLINFLPDSVKEINNNLSNDELMKSLKDTPMFNDAKGLENLTGKDDEKVVVTINTHKEIKVLDVRPDTNQGGSAVNYCHTVPNSQFFTNLHQMLHSLKTYGYNEEFRIGLENTIKNGYKLFKTIPEPQEKIQVSIQDIWDIVNWQRNVNNHDLRDIEFLGDDNWAIKIDKKLIDEFKLVGLNNMDFITSGFYKDGWDKKDKE